MGTRTFCFSIKQFLNKDEPMIVASHTDLGFQRIEFLWPAKKKKGTSGDPDKIMFYFDEDPTTGQKTFLRFYLRDSDDSTPEDNKDGVMVRDWSRFVENNWYKLFMAKDR